MDDLDGGSSLADIGRRLALLRRAMGYPERAAFALRSGLTPSELTHWENGNRRISLTGANKLRLHWRVTLDWIYHGDRSGLPLVVLNVLREAGLPEADPPAPPKAAPPTRQ